MRPQKVGRNRDQGELKIDAAVRKERSGEKVLVGPSTRTYCILSPFSMLAWTSFLGLCCRFVGCVDAMTLV